MRPAASSRSVRDLPVRWLDCAWQPRVAVRPVMAVRWTVPFTAPFFVRRGATRPPGIFPRNCESVQAKPMTKSSSHPFRRSGGFTLIELLVVIAIIAILAGLLLPVFAAVKQKVMKGKAKYEMQGLSTAISTYDSTYSRMPASKQAALAANPDFTFGTSTYGFAPAVQTLLSAKGTPLPKIQNNNGMGYQAPNSEIITILMNYSSPMMPDGVTANVNKGSLYNPGQSSLFTPKIATDTKSSGVGPDYVYRDPWGNPYIITLDMNGDNHCLDSVYSLQAVSGTGSADGLTPNNTPPDSTFAPNNYEVTGPVMMYSLGKDGSVDITKAWNQSSNKDNVISWQ